MANQATTTNKVTGSCKAVNDLWSTLQKMEVNSKISGFTSWQSTTASTTKQSKSVFVVTSIGQSMRNTQPMTTIYYPLKLKRHGMLAMSYLRRLTICYGMNSLSHTESVNVAVRSIMCMMKEISFREK